MFAKHHVFVCHVAHHIAMLALAAWICTALPSAGLHSNARATEQSYSVQAHAMSLNHALRQTI